jgi:ADP-dependent NAD(P)H-hydrate dehydratase / NAD(P)H-hydrate epimerase
MVNEAGGLAPRRVTSRCVVGDGGDRYCSAVIELLTNAEMAQADRLAVASGISSTELMENAGRAVADHIGRNYPTGTRVVVVAGAGNNGGDGYVAARLLASRGCEVHLLRVGVPGKGDASRAAAQWKGPVADAAPEGLVGAGLIADALFGAGLDRPVSGLAAVTIEAINAHAAPVVAVDLPSGINGDSGAVMGTAVKARETVTFFRRKRGHLLLPGRLHAGALSLADIGIPARVLDEIRPQAFANEPPLWAAQFPRPSLGGHKYDRGHAVVVSGDFPHTGAARLAARGALRAGAGLVTIASPRNALAVNAAASLAVMVRQADGAPGLANFLEDARLNAVLLGPGGGVGAAMQAKVRAALAGERAVVLDADALTSFAGNPAALAKAIKRRKQTAIVLTPHEGEFSRLFNKLDEVAHHPVKLEKTVVAARITGAIVLLKGPDTVVAAPDGRIAVAANAPPWLATAGSGDVLAGMITGLLAQGMPGFEAAAAAVWLHGEAATEFGPGLISEDLPEALPAVYRRLLEAPAGA